MNGKWDRRWRQVAIGMALGALALGLATMYTGCGSVAGVGTGASRSGVQPVSGAYGYDSPTQADLKEQEKKVDSLARANRRADNKTVVVATRKIKEQPDAPSEAVAAAPTEAPPTLDPAMKAVVLGQERAGSAASTPTGYGQLSGDEY